MKKPLPSAFSEALDAALADYRSRHIPAWVDEALVERITSALLSAISRGVQDGDALKQIALQAAGNPE